MRQTNRTLPRLTVALCAATSAILCPAPRAAAVPACPGPATVEQPDGTSIRIHLKGDEFFHWHESDDGYAIVKSSAGEWVYAGQDQGMLVPTNLVVGSIDPAKTGMDKPDVKQLWSAARLSAQAKSAAAAPQLAPTIGTMKNLVILVDFSDLTVAYSRQAYDDLFNEVGYTTDGAVGSVKDFYHEISYNTLTVDSTVVEAVTLDHGYAYYGANDAFGDDMRPREMVQEALAKLDQRGFDFTTVDTDHDGWIDGLTIIHAGGGEEYGGNNVNYIWSHKWALAAPVTYDGVMMQTYHTEPARRGWDSVPSTQGITRIGVICHETGHFLGLPDLYDYGYDSQGAGDFCLMASGSWNGNYGSSPAHMSAWCKVALGWVTPTVITTTDTYSATRVETTPEIYKLRGAFAANEYFLIENRQGTGFDTSLPGPSRGLLIWHVDTNVANNNDQTHYKVDLEEASGTQHLQLNTSAGGNSGNDADYYRSGSNTSLTSATTPNNLGYSANSPCLDVTSIGATGASMAFTVTNNLPVAPTSAGVTYGAGDITLSVTGGSGTTCRWFTGSCGGTEVGTGSPLTIASPASSTTYYARWEGSCGNSTCASVTVAVKPTVTTTAVSGITGTTADSGGNITADGGTAVTAYGVCWNTDGSPTVADSHTTDGAGIANFSSSMTGLSGDTTYHVRAYATNTAGTSYGADVAFTTAVTTPTVTTATPTNIMPTSATSGGNVTSAGGTPVTDRGVCWNVGGNPTIADSHTTDGEGTGSFTSSLTGLTTGTTYHVRAYATNTQGTTYGTDLTFTPSITTPTVTTLVPSNLTSTSADGGGEVTANGGTPVTNRGVCWSLAGNPTLADSFTTDGDGDGSFTSNITGLTAGTTYHVRAYATNDQGTAYGADMTFAASATTPTLTTAAVTGVTASTAESGGEVTANGGASVSARGVCWNTDGGPTTMDSKIAGGTGNGTFTGHLSGLLANTTYYVRAYATNIAGTAYGNEVTFTTTAAPPPPPPPPPPAAAATTPTVTTGEATRITSTSATCGGNVTDDGGESVTARGVCWNTTGNPTTANSKTADGTGIGVFTSALTRLAPITTYHVRAYATNTEGTSYGSETTFTTAPLPLPTVATAAVTDITDVSAACGGTVMTDGGAEVTSRGVCWGESADPPLSGSHTTDGTGTGRFTSVLTGLAPNTTYHVRAYATSHAGTVYGEDAAFTTNAAVRPGDVQLTIARAGDTEVVVGADVGFVATVTNFSAARVTGASVTLQIPSNTVFVSASLVADQPAGQTTRMIVSTGDGIVTLTFAEIPPNRSYRVSLVLRAIAAGSIAPQASLTSHESSTPLSAALPPPVEAREEYVDTVGSAAVPVGCGATGIAPLLGCLMLLCAARYGWPWRG